MKKLTREVGEQMAAATMAPVTERTNMLSNGQAARILGLSGARVYQLVKAGVLPYERTPLGYLIPREAVEALRREREARQKEAGA